jgi:ATP-dependent DNA helicase RecG
MSTYFMTHTAEVLSEMAGGEGQHREFKRLIDNPESVAGEIVAFANSEGGALYVGVDDDGRIIGLSDANTTFQSLTNSRDRCIPPISPVIEQHTRPGHHRVDGQAGT